MIRLSYLIAFISLGCSKTEELLDANLIQHTIVEKSGIEDKYFSNHELLESNENPIRISSLISNEHLILRIPFVSCEVCRTQEIEAINYFLSDFKSNVSIVLSSSSKRDAFLFNRINPTDFKIFEFKSGESFSFWDQYGKPYAILVNENLQIVGSHMAMTSYPEFSKVFYQSIQSRWSREKNVDWNMDFGK